MTKMEVIWRGNRGAFLNWKLFIFHMKFKLHRRDARVIEKYHYFIESSNLKVLDLLASVALRSMKKEFFSFVAGILLVG